MAEQTPDSVNRTQSAARGFQFGVRQLLMYFVFVAASFGLLKAPYPLLSITAKTFVIGTLITAILLAIFRTGRLRAFWVGFAVVGSIYFYLTSISESFRSQAFVSVAYSSYQSSPYYPQPSYSEGIDQHILPNWILSKAYGYIAMKLQPYTPPTVQPPTPLVPQVTNYAPQSDGSAQSGTAVQPATPDSSPATAPVATPPTTYAAPVYATPPAYSPYTVYGSPTLTYQSNGAYAISVATIPWPIFQSNGHCIFTILFAYVGGMFAQWLYVKRESK